MAVAIATRVPVNVPGPRPQAIAARSRGRIPAAAISLAGALLGFALPVANVIAHSDTLLGLAAWGVVAGVVQLLAYLVMRFTLPQLNQDIPAGKTAPAVFLAVVSLTIGLINAACMSY